MYFGRAFHLYGQRPRRTWWARLRRRPVPPRPELGLVLPCEFCGNPAFTPDTHMCDGLRDRLVEEFTRRELDDEP